MLANKPTNQLARFSIGLNEPNQDTVLAESLDNGRAILVVADGVGGSPRGDLASQIAVRVVHEEMRKHFNIGLDRLFVMIIDKFEQELQGLRAATTLTLVRCDGLKFDVGHVGDTRAYHLRSFGIRDITVDQNEGALLLKQGVFTKRDIQKYPRRNVLTSALSSDRSYDLYCREGLAEKGDRILVVSDGVYEVLQRQEIAEFNSHASSTQEFMEFLEKELRERGLKDDSSAVCFEF